MIEMCATGFACMMNIIKTVMRHKLVAFKLLTLTCYASATTRYHLVSSARYLALFSTLLL